MNQNQNQQNPNLGEIQTHINQLYHLNKEEEELKAALKTVSEKIKVLKRTLMEEIKANQLEKRPFVIGDRMIKYKLVKDTESITQKYLKLTLNKYFEADPTEAKNIFDFIVSSRGSKYQEVIDIGARPSKTSPTT